MNVLRVAREAMATRFEIALPVDRDPIRLRAAAEEALEEIQGIEERLSLYKPTSEIARVNALAHSQPVRVSSEVFQLLRRCADLSAMSQGAFDPTVGPLMRCWGFMRPGGGCEPDPDRLLEARASVGMQWVELDADSSSVRFMKPGMMIDLGAVGKGYALDVAVERLRELGIVNALIHGGTSSVSTLGTQEDGSPWKVAVESRPTSQVAEPGKSSASEPAPMLAVIELCNEALGVSAVWGKSFQSGQRERGHVMDPRLGHPVDHTQLAAVCLNSSLEADALSTALLASGAEGFSWLESARPGVRALTLSALGDIRRMGGL